MTTHLRPSFRHLSLALLLGLPALAHADVQPPPGTFDTGVAGVTGTFLEDRLSFKLVLNGGALDRDAFKTIDLGTIWRVHLNIRLIEEASRDPINDWGVDTAIVNGTVFHQLPPHVGEGLGETLNFSFSLLGAFAMVNPVDFNGNIKPSRNTTDLDHGSVHKDHYSGSASSNNMSIQLLSWSTSLSGVHPEPVSNIPEPSALQLLALGLPVLGWAALRRTRADTGPKA